MLRDILAIMRWNSPTGGILLIWPCLWGVLGGAYVFVMPVPWLKLLGFCGCAFLLRSAGCIINDMIDRPLDKTVERTISRPLASGRLSMFTAFIVLCCCVAGALSIGWLIFGWGMPMILALCVFPLILLYPCMKYLVDCPQIFLGMIFNWGLLVGFAAMSPSWDAWYSSSLMWLLYAGAFCWTIGYDTIYACQDREDDRRAKVGSLALLSGSSVQAIVYTSYVLFFVFALCSLAFMGMSIVAMVMLFFLGLHLLFQCLSFRFDDKEICRAIFISNNSVGIILCFGLLGLPQMLYLSFLQ